MSFILLFADMMVMRRVYGCIVCNILGLDGFINVHIQTGRFSPSKSCSLLLLSLLFFCFLVIYVNF